MLPRSPNRMTNLPCREGEGGCKWYLGNAQKKMFFSDVFPYSITDFNR